MNIKKENASKVKAFESINRSNGSLTYLSGWYVEATSALPPACVIKV